MTDVRFAAQPPGLRRREEDGAQAGPPQWMLDLERAHDRLRHGTRLLENGAQPVIDLRPAARALERVHGAIYDAYDERTERLQATRAALEALDEAVRSLTPGAQEDAAIGFALEYFGEAKQSLLAADTRLAPLVPRPQTPAAELRSSKDVPRLHEMDRASLAPRIVVPDPPPPKPEPENVGLIQPQTFEEMEAAFAQLRRRAEERRQKKKELARASVAPAEPEEPPPGFVRDVRPALGEDQVIWERTRQLFEEIAMIGTQRAPLLGDPWRGTKFLEDRMLYALDAIVAMGPRAVSRVEALVLDAPAKDPPRAFAAGFVMGCLAGRDALAAAERVFFALELGDPAFAEQFGAALKLAPHPLLPVVLRTLLEDEDPAHRALAIDVLAYREMATVDELQRAAFDEAPVARAALPYFALTRHAQVREAIDRALETEELREAAWIAMQVSAHPHAATALRKGLEGELQEPAAMGLAVVGDKKDAELLLEMARSKQTSRPLVTALGWAGPANAVPALIGLLRHKKEDVRIAAAYALDRLTGAGLYEEVEVKTDDIGVPDIPDPDVGDGLPKLVSDPRDLPEEPALEAIDRPTTDVDRWSAWWREKAEGYDAKARYRRGYPYTPIISVRELDGLWNYTPGERRTLQRELIARTGSYVRFDPHDFITVQEESIKLWEEPAQRASGNAGPWLLPMRR